jgi:dipeptide/tripeptide permease
MKLAFKLKRIDNKFVPCIGVNGQEVNLSRTGMSATVAGIIALSIPLSLILIYNANEKNIWHLTFAFAVMMIFLCLCLFLAVSRQVGSQEQPTYNERPTVQTGTVPQAETITGRQSYEEAS